MIGQRVLYVSVPGTRENIVSSVMPLTKQNIMPTSPVKVRIPLTSLGHLVTEVKKQLFGIEAPASVELTGLRKYFNSYTLQGRRNCVLVTYGIVAVTAAAYWMHKQHKEENQESNSTA